MSMEMDFQKLLLQVEQALDKDETKALVFLCKDLMDRDLRSVDSASTLFTLLMDQDLLSPERPYLLADLLDSIQRHRLIRELNLSNQLSTSRSLISPYRKLLYDLSEDIADDDLRQIKFLLSKRLSRKNLTDNVTTLEVLWEMEHKDLISDTDLTILEKSFGCVCRRLMKRINQFKAESGHYKGPLAQETCAGDFRSRSSSDYCSKKQDSALHPKRPASCEIQALGGSNSDQLQPSSYFSEISQQSTQLSSANTSLDARVSHNPSDMDLSHRLGLLNTNTSNCAASTATEKGLSVKGSSPSETVGLVDFQTTNTKDEGLIGTYPMIGARRGICLVINNFNFQNSIKKLNNREGTDIDENCLVSVFEWLGFKMHIERDCTRDGILSVVEDLRRADHSQMDCLVCCVLSHGLKDTVYGVDGQLVELRDVTEAFSGSNCTSLIEKPKLFFIQACQGDLEQQAVHIEADSPGSVYTDAVVSSSPSGADCLMGMATVPHFVSFRHKKQGTWFIQSLCQNLVKLVPRSYDLVSILTKVNDDVSQKTDSSGIRKQMPQPSFSLRKRVVFPIPNAHPPNLP